MPALSGLPTVNVTLPGLPLDRPLSGTARQLRQTAIALGQTVGPGDMPMTPDAVADAQGVTDAAALSPRLTAASGALLPPDPDPPAGPPPTFDITPLEKLQLPPAPLAAIRDRAQTKPSSTGAEVATDDLPTQRPGPKEAPPVTDRMGAYADPPGAPPTPRLDLRH